MSSLYEKFREKHAIKKACEDKISADFIFSKETSNEITHVRINEDKNVALVFNNKEGSDEVIVFEAIEKNKESWEYLKKGDYFVLSNNYYLIFEEFKIVKSDLSYKKYKAAECNVVFTYDYNYYNGVFLGSARKIINDTILKNSVLASDEGAILILPSNDRLKIDLNLWIGNKPWKIKDYDDITNSGIMYISLERGIKKNLNENLVEEDDLAMVYILNPDKIVDQQPTSDFDETDLIWSLRPMTEYTFSTNFAYFVSNPKVDITNRNINSVSFKIPYGIQEILISTKNSENEIIESLYKVVMK